VYVNYLSTTVPWREPRPHRWTYVASTWEYAEPASGLLVDALGFSRLDGTSSGSPYVDTWTVVPLWAVTAVAAILPASRIAARVRRSRRARGGLCPACGYDLHASPAGARSAGRSWRSRFQISQVGRAYSPTVPVVIGLNGGRVRPPCEVRTGRNDVTENRFGCWQRIG
jgi:hypothetical protein